MDIINGTALVVGGGIGGLSAALALRRTGWEVTVLERAAQATEVGAGITLMANALRALNALGVGQAIEDAGRIEASGGTRASNGRWISRIEAGEMTRRLGTEALGIHRATLHRILLDALPADCFVTGAQVVDIDPAAGRVEYRRDGQRHESTAELIVGADGIYSTVRARLFPQLPAPAYSGSTAWRGVTRERWTGELSVAISWGPGAEFGIVPLGDGRISWFGAFNAPAGGRDADRLAAARARFGDWHAPIADVLAATEPGSVLRTDIYYLAGPLPTYVRGRVALLGDAAHAMTPNLGQGGCLAIEDAVVLGSVCANRGMTGRPADLATALAAYDAQRRPRTQRMARAAYQIGRFGQQLSNPVAVAVRNAVMRLTPPSVALRTMARYSDWYPPAQNDARG